MAEQNPNLSAVAFWDVDMASIDYETSARFVIEKVMNYGLWNDVLEVLNFYGRVPEEKNAVVLLRCF